MNREDWVGAHQEALVELESARAELARAQRQVSLAERRVAHLAELAGVRKPSFSGDFISEVERVLAANGPMRLRRLREKLLEVGVPSPGKGTDANLVGRLTHSGGRIVKLGRGVYGLPEHSHS